MLQRRNPTNQAIWKSRADGFCTRHFSGETLDYRQIISIILPLLIDQAFLVCMNLVNTAMISSSGLAAVSAVNMVDSVNIFLINVFIAVATGGTVVVAQYTGRGNQKMVPKALAGSVSAVFSIALVITLLLVAFHGPILYLLFGNAEEAVFANAKTYLIGSCISYCGIAVMEAVCGALRGIGETRSSLMLSITMNLTYVLLNFVFINGLHMGVLGLVISMNIARYFAAVMAILYLIRRNKTLNFQVHDLFGVDWAMLKRIMFIGLPFAAEQMFFNGGKILTQTFIVGLGTYAMAVNAISSSIAGLFAIPANALAFAVITVVGQCMGKRDIIQAKKIVRSFFVLSSASLAVMCVLLLPFFNSLVSMFRAPKAIVPQIFIIILTYSITQIFLWPGSFLIPAALRAGGDSKYTSVLSMLSMWLFRVVLGYILGVVLPFGIIGVWVAMYSEWGVRSIIFMTRFRGKKWYQHRVID